MMYSGKGMTIFHHCITTANYIYSYMYFWHLKKKNKYTNDTKFIIKFSIEKSETWSPTGEKTYLSIEHNLPIQVIKSVVLLD